VLAGRVHVSDHASPMVPVHGFGCVSPSAPRRSIASWPFGRGRPSPEVGIVGWFPRPKLDRRLRA
jgi:hypothetical protein